ncbi:MAG TPA: sigma-70 family RNA polymerase sigma factor [Gaiellaceae bacterium]|nr:sigma-70 family RNA polymerase sigma factor [Gaiellaceae bacterium]
MEPSEEQLVAALRAGDEDAYRRIVRDWHPSLLRVAQIFVPTRALAEDVVAETWLRVLGALDRFEGRSTLRTWVFRILVNTAKTRAQREGRTIPFSALQDPARVPEAAVEPERFLPDDAPENPGGWSAPPRALPEERLLAAETRDVIARAVEALPASQRAVISLRDVEGWSSDEVRNALDISEVNQRVLLHRARSRVRRALEDYLAPTENA